MFELKIRCTSCWDFMYSLGLNFKNFNSKFYAIQRIQFMQQSNTIVAWENTCNSNILSQAILFLIAWENTCNPQSFQQIRTTINLQRLRIELYLCSVRNRKALACFTSSSLKCCASKPFFQDHQWQPMVHRESTNNLQKHALDRMNTQVSQLSNGKFFYSQHMRRTLMEDRSVTADLGFLHTFFRARSKVFILVGEN